MCMPWFPPRGKSRGGGENISHHNFRREGGCWRPWPVSLRGACGGEGLEGARAQGRSTELAQSSLPNPAASRSVKYKPRTTPRRPHSDDGAARSLITILQTATMRDQPYLCPGDVILEQLPQQRAGTPPVAAAGAQSSSPPPWPWCHEGIVAW